MSSEYYCFRSHRPRWKRLGYTRYPLRQIIPSFPGTPSPLSKLPQQPLQYDTSWVGCCCKTTDAAKRETRRNFEECISTELWTSRWIYPGWTESRTCEDSCRGTWLSWCARRPPWYNWKEFRFAIILRNSQTDNRGFCHHSLSSQGICHWDSGCNGGSKLEVLWWDFHVVLNIKEVTLSTKGSGFKGKGIFLRNSLYISRAGRWCLFICLTLFPPCGGFDHIDDKHFRLQSTLIKIIGRY